MADSITDPFSKASALQALALTLAQTGNAEPAIALFQQARQAAESITDTAFKANALGNLASSLAQAVAANKGCSTV